MVLEWLCSPVSVVPVLGSVCKNQTRVRPEYEGCFFSEAVPHSILVINIIVRDEVHGFIGELLLTLSFM